jgi:hypothetical protein
MSGFPPKAQKQARRIAALMRDHRQRFYEEVSGWEAEASERYSTELEASRHAVMSHLIETVQKRCRDKKGGALSERWKPFSHVIAKKGPAYQDLLTKHFALAGIPSPTIKLPTEVTDRPMTLREEIVVLAAIHAAVVEKESATGRADCFGALIREVSSQRGGEFWSQVALWVDDVERVLHPSPPQEEVEENAFLSAADVARIFEVPLNALRKRLERYRQSHDDGWGENQEAKRLEPRYTYRLGSVRSCIQALKAKQS